LKPVGGAHKDARAYYSKAPVVHTGTSTVVLHNGRGARRHRGICRAQRQGARVPPVPRGPPGSESNGYKCRASGLERGSGGLPSWATASCNRASYGRVAQSACWLWMDGRMGLDVRKLQHLRWESTQTAQLCTSTFGPGTNSRVWANGPCGTTGYYAYMLLTRDW
jgi:hypothetical protein